MTEDGGNRERSPPRAQPAPSSTKQQQLDTGQERGEQLHLCKRPNVREEPNDDAEEKENEDQVDDGDDDEDELPPPLPPRSGTARSPHPVKSQENLQAHPTTALSSIDIQTLQFPDGSRGTFSTSPVPARAVSSPVHLAGASGCSTPRRGSVAEVDDATSVMSMVAPTLRAPGDLASLMVADVSKKSPAWQLLRSQSSAVQPFEAARLDARDPLVNFESEFDPIPGLDLNVDDSDDQGGAEDEQRLAVWKGKLKHFMIISSAGKPIYSRHGDLSLVNSFMGVIQTIIAFYEGSKNPLLGFTAGATRFVILTEGPLHFVAISRLSESDTQIRSQLEALYMQILSTLTLPNLTSIFAHRPSTDLRKPLAGTEPLLSSLADSFTRGSPSVLLGALECLKLRKSHRAAITSAFLKSRTGDDDLLYGLIVAGGRLVSVIRPRSHSLHPSDLQLIFNMLFEGGGIRSGEGENWIPLCLPAFNNRGYLYMYVSFFNISNNPTGANPKPTTSTSTTSPPPKATPFSPTQGQPAPSHDPTGDSIAVILISPSQTSFYSLQTTRNSLITALSNGPHLSHIQTSIRSGRPSLPTTISPGTQVSHFLYKSRANVQFFAPAFDAHFDRLVQRRKLMSLYHNLHAAAHARHCHLKVLHCVAEDATSLAWITPTFELYCVAGPNVSRAAMTQGANRVVQWAKREEERLFIIGGGVF